jgi:tRNA threonylcarbamoyl adenosine modification protein (Sua5/YciO/YrdC/YwlC family)
VPRTVLLKKRRQVGIRIPDHPIALALVRGLGRPLLTTSAIPPGGDQALSDPDDVMEQFGRFVDIVVDGGLTSDEPSTVLEVTDDEVTVLREGRGPLEGILEA